MHSYRKNLLRLATLTATIAAGTLGSCGISSTAEWIAGLNPCGTVLNCDPVTYRFIKSGYVGPGANPDVDPACTYPPFCANDPFISTTGTLP
jgi:hypothetical protein